MPTTDFDPAYAGPSVPGYGNTQTHIPNVYVTPVNDTIVIPDLPDLYSPNGADVIAVDDNGTTKQLSLQGLATWIAPIIPTLPFSANVTPGNWNPNYQFQYFNTNQSIDISTMAEGLSYSFFAVGTPITITFTNGTLIGFTSGGSSTTQPLASNQIYTFLAITTSIVALVNADLIISTLTVATTPTTYITSTDKIAIYRNGTTQNSFINYGTTANCTLALDGSGNMPAVPSGATMVTNPTTATITSLQTTLNNIYAVIPLFLDDPTFSGISTPIQTVIDNIYDVIPLQLEDPSNGGTLTSIQTVVDNIYDAIPPQTNFTNSWTATDESGASLVITTNNTYLMQSGQQITTTAVITYPATANGLTATMGGFPGFSTADVVGGWVGTTYSDSATPIVIQLSPVGIQFFNPTNRTPLVNSALSGLTINLTVTYLVT